MKLNIFACFSEAKNFSILIAKLESELKSMQIYHNEQFKKQSEEMTSRQEYIMTVSYNVDEMRRRLEKFATIMKGELILFL